MVNKCVFSGVPDRKVHLIQGPEAPFSNAAFVFIKANFFFKFPSVCVLFYFKQLKEDMSYLLGFPKAQQ